MFIVKETVGGGGRARKEDGGKGEKGVDKKKKNWSGVDDLWGIPLLLLFARVTFWENNKHEKIRDAHLAS